MHAVCVRQNERPVTPESPPVIIVFMGVNFADNGDFNCLHGY